MLWYPGRAYCRNWTRFATTAAPHRCPVGGGHHGHLFDDGPPPTGERWCNNGVALRFLPRQSA